MDERIDVVSARRVAAHARWAVVPAVRAGALHEIKSCDILQPGPAALTDGLEQLHTLFARWAGAAGGACPRAHPVESP